MTLRQKQRLDKYLGNFLIAINLAAAKTLGFFLRRNHTLQPPPRNILFIKIMGTGSVLMAADAILAIKQKYPNAKLILLANHSLIAGIRPAGLFHEYWAFNDRSFLHVIGSGIRNLMRSWKRKRVWVCNLEVYSKLTTIFSLWTCARNRFDFFFNEVSFRKNINTHAVYFNQFAKAHENYNRMAEAMNAEVQLEFTFPAFPKNERSGRGDIIMVSNTCSELARERLYPDDLFADLLKQVSEKYRLRVMLTGTAADAGYYNAILQNAGLGEPEFVNTAGRLTMEEFMEHLYHRCRLLLTVDSAPLHFAYRLGTPTVSLWGPTNPATRMKENDQFKSVYLAVHCSPCTHHTNLLPCGGDNFCMKRMSVELVMQKVDEVMTNLDR